MPNPTAHRASLKVPAALLAAGIVFLVFALVTDVINPVIGWWGFVAAFLAAAVATGRAAKRRMVEHKATLDRAFAERGLRGAARVVDYDPVGSATRDRARFKLTLEIDAPGWADTRTYWLSVHPVDIARLTTIDRMPCVVVPDDQPVVRLYLRRNVDATDLDGDGVLAIPHPAGML